jgi:hypothetical protein
MSRTVDYDIREPIWDGGNWKVGIANFRLKRDSITITISYKDKYDIQLFPDKYFISSNKAKQFPTKEVNAGGRSIVVHEIPLSEFETVS